MKQDNKKNLGIFIRIAMVLAMFIVIVLNYDYLTNLDIRALVENSSSIFISALIIIGVYALKSVVFVVPASLIYICVGMSFDVRSALIINLIGISAEVIITYFAGMFLGGEYVTDLLKKSKGGKKLLEAKTKTQTSFLFLVRVVPAFPIDFTSLFLGASKYNFIRYFLISLLGIYPRVALFTVLGDGIYKLIPKEIIIKTVIIAIPVALCAYLIYKLIKNKKVSKELQ